MAWTLPLVAAMLLAGVLSDQFERRRLLILSDLVRCSAIALLGLLALAGEAELWHLIVLVAVYGAGEALFQPAFTAIVPDVVRQGQLLQANALRELVEPLGLRFAGPALGGALIATFGVGTALLVDASTFVISALLLVPGVRDPERHPLPAGRAQPISST